MTQPARTLLLVGSLVLCVAVAACAEGSAQTETTSSASGNGGDDASGSGGSGGDGGSPSGKTSSSSSTTSTTSTVASTGSGDGGAGGGETSCGNNVCDPQETCANCPNDCTTGCDANCGDGSCNGTDTCQSCPDDCGPCNVVCGDGACADGEQQSCPQDCVSTGAGGAGCPADVCTAGGTWTEECLLSGDQCIVCAVTAAGIGGGVCEPGSWSQDCADAALGCGLFGTCPCSPF